MVSSTLTMPFVSEGRAISSHSTGQGGIAAGRCALVAFPGYWQVHTWMLDPFLPLGLCTFCSHFPECSVITRLPSPERMSPLRCQLLRVASLTLCARVRACMHACVRQTLCSSAYSQH